MPSWWQSGVVYHVYVRSFADSDGDGVGDLRGVLKRLDHLEWFGVDGIWLSPTFPSPNADWGYDVADYRSVHPELGTDADLEELVARAGARGIRVLLDLVPNHTSDRHPWFAESRASRDSPRRGWYVWADGRDGGPPNNWQSTFGGPAWTRDAATGQWYLHNFLPEQPDLNWWNEDVRAEFERILRFWFDRGVAGFRIDVANALVNDRELRDNPPAAAGSDAAYSYNMNRPEVHEIFRRWREIADVYDPQRILVGETWVMDPEERARFYGDGTDELHLAFNFDFVLAPFEAARLARAVADTERTLPGEAWPVWTLSNHDVVRFPTRWCGDDPARVRLALLLLLTLRGTPVLYYGDELGLPQARLARADLRDPVGIRGWPEEPGRDGARTPMPWTPEPKAATWLPQKAPPGLDVETQRADPGSPLHLVRDLLALRRDRPDLATGSYEQLPAPDGVWAWRRGDSLTVALNLSDEAAELDGVEGTILIGTDRGRDGEDVRGPALAPWEGVVVERR